MRACHIHFTTALCLALVGGSAESQERFSDVLSGHFVHQGARPGFKLDRDYTYDDGAEVWKTPAGYTVDGASKAFPVYIEAYPASQK